MKTRLLLASLVLVLASALVGFQLGAAAADGPAPVAIVVDTPSAPHPKARVRVLDLEAGVVRFDWLDAQGQPADSGDSVARITVTGESITADQRAILAAAITAATAQ